jgi:hypothetical protein
MRVEHSPGILKRGSMRPAHSDWQDLHRDFAEVAPLMRHSWSENREQALECGADFLVPYFSYPGTETMETKAGPGILWRGQAGGLCCGISTPVPNWRTGVEADIDDFFHCRSRMQRAAWGLPYGLGAIRGRAMRVMTVQSTIAWRATDPTL